MMKLPATPQEPRRRRRATATDRGVARTPGLVKGIEAIGSIAVHALRNQKLNIGSVVSD